MMFEQYIEIKGRMEPSDNQPNPMLLKAKEYASRFSIITNKATVQKIRE